MSANVRRRWRQSRNSHRCSATPELLPAPDQRLVGHLDRLFPAVRVPASHQQAGVGQLLRRAAVCGVSSSRLMRRRVSSAPSSGRATCTSRVKIVRTASR